MELIEKMPNIQGGKGHRRVFSHGQINPELTAIPTHMKSSNRYDLQMIHHIFLLLEVPYRGVSMKSRDHLGVHTHYATLFRLKIIKGWGALTLMRDQF